MNEMIDLVAEALFAHDGCTEWGAVTDELREPWRGKARVAIAAMREPTAEMIRAGASAQLRTTRPLNNALDAWQAMSDEALK